MSNPSSQFKKEEHQPFSREHVNSGTIGRHHYSAASRLKDNNSINETLAKWVVDCAVLRIDR